MATEGEPTDVAAETHDAENEESKGTQPEEDQEAQETNAETEEHRPETADQQTETVPEGEPEAPADNDTETKADDGANNAEEAPATEEVGEDVSQENVDGNETEEQPAEAPPAAESQAPEAAPADENQALEAAPADEKQAPEATPAAENEAPVPTPAAESQAPKVAPAADAGAVSKEATQERMNVTPQVAQQPVIPEPPPIGRSQTFSDGSETASPNALGQVWSFGMNRSVPVINITDDTRKMIFYTCAHTGILYDFHGNQQLLLRGHANSITCTCVSNDKRWVCTADVGKDNMVVVWDSYTGVPVRNIFDPHPEGIVAMAMTPDAKHLVTLSAGEKQVLSIFDWTVEGDALCSVELEPHFGLQTFVLFNPEDTSQLVSNSDSQVIFYSWRGNSVEYFAPPLGDEDFNKPVGKYSQSIFIENSSRILTATSLGNLVVWDTQKNASNVADKGALKLVKLQEKGINVITTSDQLIVTGDVLGHVKFFDQSLKLLNWYQDFHLGPVNSLSFAYFPSFDDIPEGAHEYPPDATIKAKPFVIRDFVVGTANAVFGHVHTDGTDVTVIHRDHDSAVYALAPHPFEAKIAVGSYSGHLKIWDYETKTVINSKIFEKGFLIRCCDFDPKGQMIAVGFTNGSIRVLDATSLDDLLQEPIRYARDSITHIGFSHDARYIAAADAEYTVTLLKRTIGEDDPYVYVGRHRAHYKAIHDLLFGVQLDSNTPRLLTLGQDRVLVEYDLENATKDNLPLLSSDRIEQSAIPYCMAWYPPVTKESFIVTANDQFKLKLYNSTTKMCRKTLLGPTYGSPIQKIAILPATPEDVKGKRYLAYITADKVGLHSLPLDGNPHNAMAFIAHPQGVGNLCCSYDGKYLFTAGGNDASVHMWSINITALEAQAKLGGEDLIPFYGLLDGGREGDLFKELENYFYYAQIRSQGVDTMNSREVSTVIPITEIPFVMRALGFYPSEQEIDDMLNEVKFSDYVETGKYRTTIDLGDFIKLYINHRPAFGLQPDKLAWAFHTLGYALDGMPSIDRSELLHILQNRGEHMTEYELAEYLTTLLGFNAEGGSSELHDFDTMEAGDLIDENLPHEITADMFANELLGFDMYADVLPVEGENSPGTPVAS